MVVASEFSVVFSTPSALEEVQPALPLTTKGDAPRVALKRAVPHSRRFMEGPLVWLRRRPRPKKFATNYAQGERLITGLGAMDRPQLLP